MSRNLNLLKFSIVLICFILFFGSIDCSSAQAYARIDSAEELSEMIDVVITSPSDVEGRKVRFDAETGLSREEERVNRIKLYWVITGENLRKPLRMAGHERYQTFRNGDYEVELTVTDKFRQEYYDSTSFTVDEEDNEPLQRGFNRYTDREDSAEELSEMIDVAITSPSDVEGRRVRFDAETGLSREEERVNRVKLYWVITGDNLRKPLRMAGHERYQTFRNGDYDVELTVTDRFRQEYYDSTSFTVDEEDNEPLQRGYNYYDARRN